jgi:hypothetical protein
MFYDSYRERGPETSSCFAGVYEQGIDTPEENETLSELEKSIEVFVGSLDTSSPKEVEEKLRILMRDFFNLATHHAPEKKRIKICGKNCTTISHHSLEERNGQKKLSRRPLRKFLMNFAKI